MSRKNIIFIGALVFALWGSSTASAAFVAADNADNDPYSVTGFLPGDNGGFGFSPWVNLETGVPGAMYTTASIAGGSYSWGLNGTYALGRGLSLSLTSGSWTFLALHDSDNAEFSGFNLKSSTDTAGFATDELFRVGMDPNQIGYDGTGVYISTNVGFSYEFLDCGWVDGAGDTIEYSIGWDTIAGTYNLSVSNQTEGVLATFDGAISIGLPVAMLGSGVFGADNSESLTFDSYGVVPEPSSFCLLALGMLTLRSMRRSLFI